MSANPLSWLMSIRCPVCRGPIDTGDVKEDFLCPHCGAKLATNKLKAIGILLAACIVTLPLALYLVPVLTGFLFGETASYINFRLIFWLFYGLLVVIGYPLLISQQTKRMGSKMSQSKLGSR